jgi:hypothetical protein
MLRACKVSSSYVPRCLVLTLSWDAKRDKAELDAYAARAKWCCLHLGGITRQIGIILLEHISNILDQELLPDNFVINSSGPGYSENKIAWRDTKGWQKTQAIYLFSMTNQCGSNGSNMAPKFAFMCKLHPPRGQEVHTLVLSGLQMVGDCKVGSSWSTQRNLTACPSFFFQVKSELY